MTKTKRMPYGLGCAALMLAAVVSLVSCRGEAPPAGRGLELKPNTLPGGGHPFAVVARDFNGDAKLDLAVSNPKVSQISIYIGRGDGSFEEPAHFSTGTQPRGLVAEDFNEDGRLDLAAASTGRNAVALHLGRGDGSFEPAKFHSVRSRPFMLEPTDLNQDGHLDLVVSNEGERDHRRGLSVLLGDGRGGFSVQSYTTGRFASDVAPADFNQDGEVDVAVATWGTNDVNLHFGRGDGTFSGRRSFTYVGHGLYRVLAADLDRDGNLDMVWNDLRRDGLYVLYGNGEGGFPRTRLLPAGRGVRHAAAGDLNADGWLDLVSANTGAGEISVILSDGKGDFLPTQTYASGVLPRMVAVGDLNGDGRPDLVVTNLRSDDVRVFLNQGPAPLQVVAEKPKEQEEAPREVARLELASFRYPNGLALDRSGESLLVADQQNHRIARVEIASGEITTVAGTAKPGSAGDGGPAIAAQLRLPSGVATDEEGNIYIADFGNNRVRKVDPSGIITTVAGTGEGGYAGDGGPGASAQLSRPFALALDEAGALYISDFGNGRVRRLGPDGNITTVAGGDAATQPAAEGHAPEPALGPVTGLAFDENGNLLLADQFRFRIRRLEADGTLTTVAGSGSSSQPGEGGPATAASLSYPSGVATDGAGNIYVADQDGNRIRKISPDGIIHTHAGDFQKFGYSGDGGPAVDARIWFPSHVVADAHGNVFFTDRYNHCIRKVDPSGIITTVAGSPDPKALAELGDRLWVDKARQTERPAPQAPSLDARLKLEWEYKFRSGSDANAAYAVVIDEEGGIYLAGDVGSGADWRLLRLSPDGKKAWSFDFDSGSVDIPYALTLTPDGQVVSAGTVLARDRTYALVISLSREGKENWRYEGRGKGRQILHGIAADKNNNLYVAGQSNWRWIVQSLSPTGELRWTYTGETGAARAIDVDERGHVVVAGNEGRVWRTIRLDSNGKLLSPESEDPANRVASATAYGVRLVRGGEAVVAGSQTLKRGHARVERLEATGRRVWEYLGQAGLGASGRAVDIDPEGNAVVAGEIASDWLMFGLDPRGKLRWRFTYEGGGGTQNPDQAHAVAVHPGGGFVVAGVVHPVPPKPPSLGAVEWRIARYRVLENPGDGES